MSNFKIELEHPWLLLLLIPVLFFSLFPFFRLSRKYRRNRNRIISVVMHTLAMLLCVAMVVGLTFTYELPNKKNELIVLVDRSDSGVENEALREEFLQDVINACDKNYKLGVVSFGWDAVYAAPLSYDKREGYRQYLSALEPDVGATNLAGAITFAAEQFENPNTAKILILSDGLQTDGDALSAVKLAAAKGIKVDAVNLANTEHNEMQILDVKMPENRIVPGQTATVTLTIQTNLKAEESATLNVTDMGYKSGSHAIRLVKGIQKVEIQHTFQSGGLHDLNFQLVGADSSDTVEQNNVYHAYLNIPLLENILILESKQGEADALESILGQMHTVQVFNIHEDADLIPKNVRELSAYEEVFLVNLSNADLTSDTMPPDFVQTLYDYVYNIGGGLFTVGGENDTLDGGTLVPHAYNRLDMEGTLFQQMLPVQVVEYTPPLAVMIVIDASGSMSMGKYEAALKAAEEILGSLSARDYCGVTTFDTTSTEAISVLPVAQKDRILDAIHSLNSTQGGSGSGGTVFAGAIELAGRAIAPIPVERRHIVLITDGDPSDHLEEQSDNDKNSYGKYILDNYNQNGITMSIFALSRSANKVEELTKAAEEYGHGHFYDIPSGELNRVQAYAKSDMAEVSLKEYEEGITFTPKVRDQSTVLNGIDTTTVIPSLKGYYGTKIKEGAKVPLIYQYVPIYAEWDFGAGRVGSFLSDLGGAWSVDFIKDAVGQRIVENIADSLSPSDDLEPDRLELVLRMLEENYSTRLNVYTTLGEGESVSVKVKPLSDAASRFYGGDVPVTSLGDNVGFDFFITCGGVYRITVTKTNANGETLAERTEYKVFSYSEEYRMFRDEDEGAKLLEQLTQNGNGEMITDAVETYATFAKTYPKTTDPRIVFLILAIVCVLIDVAVRKFKFKWPHELIRDRKNLKRLADEKAPKER
ncbi:MAG TPA: hypothetical protein DDW30_03750 [Clostridiales bacterium]|nr:hypothetical protein [Clostridiales bacterium]